MKVITPTLVDSLLEFANTEAVDIGADNVDEICRPHRTGPVWRKLDEMKDHPGRAALLVMHGDVRRWLDILIHDGTTKKRALAQEIVKRVWDASEMARISYEDLNKQPGEITFPLTGFPEPLINSKGDLSFHVTPLRTGIYSIILYGMLEIYSRRLTSKINRCQICKKYYVEKPRLRVTCSEECKRVRRSGRVDKAVKKHRAKKRREKAH